MLTHLFSIKENVVVPLGLHGAHHPRQDAKPLWGPHPYVYIKTKLSVDTID